MFNYSQEKGAPKLLMEFSRNEEVPRLVTYQEVSKSKDARNRLLLQARAQTQPRVYTHTERKPPTRPNQITELQDKLEGARGENEELRVAVKDLSSELEKLRQVNEGLIYRLKEVENAYRTLRSDLERTQQQEQRRLKNSIYTDVQEYIKVVVERLTLNLKLDRMTPALQNKLERFLAQLMEINSVTVQQFLKRSKAQPVSPPPQQIQEFTESRSKGAAKFVTEYKHKRNQMPTQEHYATIMQRLTGQAKMSKSYAGAGMPYGSSSVSQDTRLRTVYATTPQKRRRIFE